MRRVQLQNEDTLLSIKENLEELAILHISCLTGISYTLFHFLNMAELNDCNLGQPRIQARLHRSCRLSVAVYKNFTDRGSGKLASRRFEISRDDDALGSEREREREREEREREGNEERENEWATPRAKGVSDASESRSEFREEFSAATLHALFYIEQLSFPLFIHSLSLPSMGRSIPRFLRHCESTERLQSKRFPSAVCIIILYFYKKKFGSLTDRENGETASDSEEFF